MRIRIEGSDLPGRRSGGEAHTLRLRGVHVGVQRTGPGRQVAIAGLIPVDAEAAVWAIEVTSREIDGLLDVGGPWVHGRPGARFLYLSWGVPGDSPGPAGPAGSAGPAGPGGPAGLGGPAGPAGPALPAGSVSPSGASAEGAAGDGAFGGGGGGGVLGGGARGGGGGVLGGGARGGGGGVLGGGARGGGGGVLGGGARGGGGGVLGGGARGGGAASSGAASIGAADFAGFRRAKLMFGDVPGDLLRAAHEGNAVLIGRLGLTDAENLPVAARIRPPAIVWSIE